MLTLTCVAAMGQSSGWHYEKADPVTKKRIVQIDASSFEQIAGGQAKLLHGVSVRFYNGAGLASEPIKSQEAIVDQISGTLMYGPHLKTVVQLANQK